jgi:hypothetical protein
VIRGAAVLSERLKVRCGTAISSKGMQRQPKVVVADHIWIRGEIRRFLDQNDVASPFSKENVI